MRKKGIHLNRLELRWKKNYTEHKLRLDSLFDGIVGSAMIMMALEISIPITEAFDEAVLIELLKEITIYLISFLALFSVWAIHTLASNKFSIRNISSYLLNVVLLFVITIFPILTKPMSSMKRTNLLWAVYLGG